MSDRTSISPPKTITIEGKIYEVRTTTQWKDGGRSGTIDDSTPPTVVFDYKEQGPLSQWKTIADRTGNAQTNNGWSFRPLAGPGFKKALVAKGPNSLSSQLDNATQMQLAKDAVVPIARAQQSLKNVTTTKTNQSLAAANQNPTAPAGGQNQGQTGTDQTGDGSNTPDLKDLQEAVKEGLNTRVRFPGAKGSAPLVYPEDIRTTKQDVIKFSMLKYEPKGFSTTENVLAQIGTRSSNRDIIGTVILPIPSGISDTSAADWGSETLNPAEAAAANIALTTITKGFGAGGALLGSAAEQVSENSSGVKTAVSAAIASAATGIGQQILTRTTGAVINPNMELLFRGPTLRPFSFIFKMSARNAPEAKQIIQIIRFFQQGMAPQRSASQLFLKSPHTFKIAYQYRGGENPQDHPYIGAIKECALQNFTVNYTPEAQYATFYDGPMVSYEMTMQFQELEPVFNEDYGNDAIFPTDLLFRESKEQTKKP